MIDTEPLRAICKELINEENFDSLQDLLSLLCAVVDADHAEVRARLPLVGKRHPLLRRFAARAND